MTKHFYWVLLCVVIFASSTALAQEDNKIQERVDVVNIEVPFRVFLKGQTVAGLTRDDFDLKVNGKRVTINGFYESHRKLSAANTPADPALADATPASRLFVLIFNVGDITQDLNKGIERFFHTIFRPKDRLIVVTNSTFLNERCIDDPAAELANLKRLISLDVQNAKQELINLEGKISSDLDQLYTTMSGGDGENDTIYNCIRVFFDSYLMRVQQYRQNYLNPGIQSLSRFAEYIKMAQGDKWILNFIYSGSFPQMSLSSGLNKIIRQLQFDNRIGNDITALMADVDKELFGITHPFLNDVVNIFKDTGATVHSLFLNPKYQEINQDWRYRKINIEIENVLYELAVQTGGKALSTNKFGDFYSAIESHEDICYTLSYVPAIGHQPMKNKIEISTRNANYRISYDNGNRAVEFKQALNKDQQSNPAPRITKLAVADRILQLKLDQIKIEKKDEKELGQARLRLRIVDSLSRTLFDKIKTIISRSAACDLMIKLPILKNGEYFVIAEIIDLATGKNDLQTAAFRHFPPVAQPDLQ